MADKLPTIQPNKVRSLTSFFFWPMVGVAALLLLAGCSGGDGDTAPPPQNLDGSAARIADATVLEGNSGTTNLIFTVSLSEVAESEVVVGFSTGDGSATAGIDYSVGSGSLIIPAGESSSTITVPVRGDSTSEPDETFTVILSNPVGATLDKSLAIGTIIDDDIPTATIASAAVLEGNSGTTNLNFIVSLSAIAWNNVMVNYSTSDSSATAGGDYTVTSGTLTISAGETSGAIIVPVTGDTTHESDETFTVNLANPVGATLVTSLATGTIIDDDFLTASIDMAMVMEGDSGSGPLSFIVTLSSASGNDVALDYSTADKGATAGVDYITTAGTLTIPAGELVGNIDVPVIGDTVFEPNEDFTLTLTTPTVAALGIASVIGTIVNDDPGGLNDTGITVCNNGINNVDCVSVGATATTNGVDSQGYLVSGGQDGIFGRDANSLTNSNADGHAGFSFTRVCNSGEIAGQGTCPATPSLGSGDDSWGCTYDNVTGLLWEVKTSDSGLRDKRWTCTWYNSDPAGNGGDPGTENGGGCYDSTNCDTEKYAAQVNATGLCGHNDWRMPSRLELRSLVDYSNSSSFAVDQGFFPNSSSQYMFWSSSTSAGYPSSAWVVWGDICGSAENKSDGAGVRLVRTGH